MTMAGASGFGGGTFGGRLPDYITGSPTVQGGGGLAGAAFRTTLVLLVEAQRLQNAGFSFAAGTSALAWSDDRRRRASWPAGRDDRINRRAGSRRFYLLPWARLAGRSARWSAACLAASFRACFPDEARQRDSRRQGRHLWHCRIAGQFQRARTDGFSRGGILDAIFQIADQLGGGVDASRGRVSFGMRKDSFRVDPTGRGITKIGNGAVDFGSDQEAAIRFAIQDLIKDGVITGISQASQNLLQRGGDLEAQIERRC